MRECRRALSRLGQRFKQLWQGRGETVEGIRGAKRAVAVTEPFLLVIPHCRFRCRRCCSRFYRCGLVPSPVEGLWEFLAVKRFSALAFGDGYRRWLHGGTSPDGHLCHILLSPAISTSQRRHWSLLRTANRPWPPNPPPSTPFSLTYISPGHFSVCLGSWLLMELVIFVRFRYCNHYLSLRILVASSMLFYIGCPHWLG